MRRRPGFPTRSGRDRLRLEIRTQPTRRNGSINKKPSVFQTKIFVFTFNKGSSCLLTTDTHIHFDSVEGKNGSRRIFGRYEAVELVIVPVPFDGVEQVAFQGVQTLELNAVSAQGSRWHFDAFQPQCVAYLGTCLEIMRNVMSVTCKQRLCYSEFNQSLGSSQLVVLIAADNLKILKFVGTACWFHEIFFLEFPSHATPMNRNVALIGCTDLDTSGRSQRRKNMQPWPVRFLFKLSTAWHAIQSRPTRWYLPTIQSRGTGACVGSRVSGDQTSIGNFDQ